jgi:1-acyl-sn-glycerol-3-phosphate acyltransferase
LPLPAVMRSRVIGFWAYFIVWWLGVSCGLKHRVTGRENLPRGPAVVLCKHESAWETIAAQTLFPPQAWVLKRELLWIPLFGWALAATRPISIDRSARVRALDQMLRQGRQCLEQGRWVVVFPQGTRMAPGEMGRFNPGGAMLAVKSQVPVVPVAHNAGTYWRRRGFLKHPGTIEVRIGPPIDTRERKAREVNDEARTFVEKAMAEIG